MSEKTISLNGYTVERQDSFAGIKIWSWTYGKKIYPAYYFGVDRAAGKYFFKTNNKKFKHIADVPDLVLVYSEANLNTESFHPMLLDFDAIAAFERDVLGKEPEEERMD